MHWEILCICSHMQPSYSVSRQEHREFFFSTMFLLQINRKRVVSKETQNCKKHSHFIDLFPLTLTTYIKWQMASPSPNLHQKRDIMKSFQYYSVQTLSMAMGTTIASSHTHDIHSQVFPYFSLWRKTYVPYMSHMETYAIYIYANTVLCLSMLLYVWFVGKIFVYWLGMEPFLYAAEPGSWKKGVFGYSEGSSGGNPTCSGRIGSWCWERVGDDGRGWLGSP